MEQHYINKTKAWIQDFVVTHNLCPFASKPFFDDKIGYHVIKSVETEVILSQFFEVAASLKNDDRISNAFVILPALQLTFLSYLDLFGLAEELLKAEGLDGDFQLVSFHPKYQFADLNYDDPVNMTNRSPFMMIHILRVDEVAEAIEAYGDTALILDANKKKLISFFN